MLTVSNRHRTAAIAIVIASALLLLTPEAYRLGDLFEQTIQWPRERVEEAARSAPPAKLSRRTGDEARYPRERFGFVLESPGGERVDTWAGTVTKDMIGAPDTTIALRLSEAQLDTLYRQALDIRLFDELVVDPSDRQSSGPRGPLHLVIRAGSVQRTLVVRITPAWVGGRWRDDTKRFVEWLDLVRRIVRSRPEYQALPRARGVYID